MEDKNVEMCFDFPGQKTNEEKKRAQAINLLRRDHKGLITETRNPV